MSRTDASFVGSIPDIYDAHLVPILFEGYAADLARRVAADDPGAVLEVAAGSGAVTRALAPRLSPKARLVVTNLNGAMLERARARQPDAERLEWKTADALALPFEDDSFDAVLCQFGVMFFPDRVAGYAQAARVLRPGGRFVFNTWGPLQDNDFSCAAAEVVAEIWPDDPPRFLARTPFGYADPARIEADLADAGFRDTKLRRVDLESRTEAAGDFAHAQCRGSPLRLEIEARGSPPLDEVVKAVTGALAARFGAGPTVGRMSAFVVEATAP